VQEVVSLSADAISESIEPELTDEMVQAFDVAKPFTYQLVFDIQPTLRWKQPYQGMKVKHHQACHAVRSYIHTCTHSYILLTVFCMDLCLFVICSHNLRLLIGSENTAAGFAYCIDSCQELLLVIPF